MMPVLTCGLLVLSSMVSHTDENLCMPDSGREERMIKKSEKEFEAHRVV